MKKVALFIALLFATSLLSAQIIGRFYYNKKWGLTKKDSVVFFRTAIFDTTNYLFVGEVNDYTKNGKPVMKGVYKFGKRNGTFTFYHINGQIESSGEFVENERAGIWKYFHGNGKVKSEIEFISGQFDKILFYNDSIGTRLMENGKGFWSEEYTDSFFDEPIINEGNYKNNLKEGEWICHLQKGKIIYKEKYEKGKLLLGTFFNPDDSKSFTYSKPVNNHLLIPFQIERTEKMGFAMGTSKSDYPFLKRVQNEVFFAVEDSAYPLGGIASFYQEVERVKVYPREAKRMGIEGRVFVEFIINMDGTLTDFKVAKGIGGGCDEEAVRAIRESTLKIKWVPGMQRGQPVRQRYSLPIIFKLN